MLCATSQAAVTQWLHKTPNTNLTFIASLSVEICSGAGGTLTKDKASNKENIVRAWCLYMKLYTQLQSVVSSLSAKSLDKRSVSVFPDSSLFRKITPFVAVARGPRANKFRRQHLRIATQQKSAVPACGQNTPFWSWLSLLTVFGPYALTLLRFVHAHHGLRKFVDASVRGGTST